MEQHQCRYVEREEQRSPEVPRRPAGPGVRDDQQPSLPIASAIILDVTASAAACTTGAAGPSRASATRRPASRRSARPAVGAVADIGQRPTYRARRSARDEPSASPRPCQCTVGANRSGAVNATVGILHREHSAPPRGASGPEQRVKASIGARPRERDCGSEREWLAHALEGVTKVSTAARSARFDFGGFDRVRACSPGCPTASAFKTSLRSRLPVIKVTGRRFDARLAELVGCCGPSRRFPRIRNLLHKQFQERFRSDPDQEHAGGEDIHGLPRFVMTASDVR